MSFLYNLKKNYQIASHIRNEQARINNLDWEGLEKHLKAYHEHFLYRELIPTTLKLIEMKDPLAFKSIEELFSDKEFGMTLEKCNYGMLYLGWSKGVGLINEDIIEEKIEFDQTYELLKKNMKEILLNKGVKDDFIINCFSAIIMKMFEIGNEYGYKTEFIDFRPRTSVHIPR